MTEETNAGFYGGCGLMIVFMAYGIVQIYAGYVGVDFHLGAILAILA